MSTSSSQTKNLRMVGVILLVAGIVVDVVYTLNLYVIQIEFLAEWWILGIGIALTLLSLAFTGSAIVIERSSDKTSDPTSGKPSD